jgi:hypothetical protein
MKLENPLKYWFTMLLLLLLASVVIVGCKSKPIEQKHTIEKVIETKYDSTSVIQVSKAIQDSLFIKINEIKTIKPECDSITNAEIKKVLQRLNSIKKSGNNEFGVFYDALENQLVIYANLKESIDRDTRVLKGLLEQNKELKSETVEVKVYPKWLLVLSFIGVLFILFLAWRFSKIFMT